MQNYPQIKTDRLILRGFKLSDASQVQELAGDTKIAEMTLAVPHPYETGMAETWISTHLSDLEKGTGVVFALVHQESDQLIGAMGLVINKTFHRAELGYWIGAPFWGNGYATEAALEVLNYGFTVMKLNKINATHMVHNPASGRVMEKIGMTTEGLLKQHVHKDGKFIDLAAYAILAENWQQKQGE